AYLRARHLSPRRNRSGVDDGNGRRRRVLRRAVGCLSRRLQKKGLARPWWLDSFRPVHHGIRTVLTVAVVVVIPLWFGVRTGGVTVHQQHPPAKACDRSDAWPGDEHVSSFLRRHN